MANPQHHEPALTEALHVLGNHLVYPPTPDIASTVHRELASNPVAPRNSWWKPHFQRRQLASLAATAILALAIVIAAIPGARTAAADWFGLPGVIFFTESTRTVEITPIGNRYRIGRTVTLDEAREQVPYAVLVPAQPGLEEPDEVWLNPIPVDGEVWFIYHTTDEIPKASVAGAGLLISQVRGELNPRMYGKGIPTGTQVDKITVHGRPGYWITGDPHTFSYFDPDGEMQQDTLRLAGNTLLWQQGDLTLRLESALDRDRAIAIAESMR